MILELGSPKEKHMVAAKGPNCIKKRVITSRVPKTKGNTSIIDRYSEDERCRVHLQSEEKVKEWDRIATLPKREHVPTDAAREHCQSTYSLKQTTAGGAGTVVPTKHPGLPKNKRMASRAFSSKKTQYFHTTTDFQQPVARLEWWARLDQFKPVIKKMVKEEIHFSKSSVWRTRTLTLTNLRQRRSFWRPKA